MGTETYLVTVALLTGADVPPSHGALQAAAEVKLKLHMSSLSQLQPHLQVLPYYST